MPTVEPIFFEKLPEDLNQEWNLLLKASGPPWFQYEFNYMSSWTELLRESWKPFLLKVKEQDRVIGLFPLMYLDEKRRGILPYRRVRFLGMTRLDFSKVLAGRHDVEGVVNAGLDWLFRGNLRWELLILDNLIEGDPVVDALKTWTEKNSVDHLVTERKYYYIDLDRNWEDVRLGMSKKAVRRSINLARNRLNKSGDWEVAINPEWETDRIFSEAALMHIERQAQLDRQSSFSDQTAKDWMRGVIKSNREKGLFSSYWLKLDQTYIAYLFGFEEDRIFYAWNMAFHPEYGNFFPSKLLMYEIIEDCHKRELKEFNFMRGETDYKTQWTKTSRINYGFSIKNTKSLYGKTVLAMENFLTKLQGHED